MVTQFLFALAYEKKLQEQQLTSQDILLAQAEQEVERQRETHANLASGIDDDW